MKAAKILALLVTTAYAAEYSSTTYCPPTPTPAIYKGDSTGWGQGGDASGGGGGDGSSWGSGSSGSGSGSGSSGSGGGSGSSGSGGGSGASATGTAPTATTTGTLNTTTLNTTNSTVDHGPMFTNLAIPKDKTSGSIAVASSSAAFFMAVIALVL